MVGGRGGFDPFGEVVLPGDLIVVVEQSVHEFEVSGSTIGNGLANLEFQVQCQS